MTSADAICRAPIFSHQDLCYGAEGMIKGHEAGAGAVVTKTIRLGAAINPVHHMGTVNQDSLINCEKWLIPTA